MARTPNRANVIEPDPDDITAAAAAQTKARNAAPGGHAAITPGDVGGVTDPAPDAPLASLTGMTHLDAAIARGDTEALLAIATAAKAILTAGIVHGNPAQSAALAALLRAALNE